MGAEPWSYVSGYQKDINAALQDLRRKEFEAGRYSTGFGEYGKPGRHASIEEAMEEADADGTSSILDIEQAMDVPDNGLEPDCGIAYPLNKATLFELFGTDQPSREEVENEDALDEIYEGLGRGSAIYVICYKDGKPNEIFWAGYSYD